ncbi:MAG: extracellular solute-binding protein [Oscillospiraceae bacterium]|nr:extracellular solute-binding protein [Oscillospiraceae bacterium]
MKKKLLALLLALCMVFGLVACGGSDTKPDPDDTTPDDASFYGPIYDEWSEKTDEELYQMALEELKDGKTINVYATSSKMLKNKEAFEEAFPGLTVDIMDLDNDEVLQKCVLEANANNVQGDVLQVKDVNGQVFYEYYEDGYIAPYYPKDICAHISEDLLRYGYPLYASQAFWYYNTEAFPDDQPLNSWWQIIERNEDGTQKYRLFTKDIGSETAYLSILASFIVNADKMEANYKEVYGTDLEYTYDPSGFDFEVPEKNAGVEFLWRLSQMKITFISDGDELVEAVHNSTADDPALALASAGKIGNRDDSGFNIGWLVLNPYNGLENIEYMYVVNNCSHPAGARLFIRFVTGGADGESGGFKPFQKEGNWPVRDDIKDKKNDMTLEELNAMEPDLAGIYNMYLDAQDLWNYWLSLNPNIKS